MKMKIVAILFAAMLPLMAQPGGGRGPRGAGGPGMGGPGMGGPGNLGFLSGYLGLTDSQKTSAQAIFDAAKAEAEAARGAAEAARDALQAGVKAGTSDTQIDTLAAAVGAAEAKQIAIRAKSEVKFRSLLTAEQIAKLDTRAGRGRP